MFVSNCEEKWVLPFKAMIIIGVFAVIALRRRTES